MSPSWQHGPRYGPGAGKTLERLFDLCVHHYRGQRLARRLLDMAHSWHSPLVNDGMYDRYQLTGLDRDEGKPRMTIGGAI